MVCKISDFIRPEWIIDSLRGSSKAEVLEEISSHLSASCNGIDKQQLFQKLMERELKASTGAERGLAIPHATIPGVPSLIVSVARSPAGVEFGAIDSEPSDLFFTIVNPAGPQEAEMSYLQALSAVCRMARTKVFRSRMKSASGSSAIYDIIVREAGELQTARR